jgi:tetratricopeptide (TPR) repeat protein
VLDQAPEPPNPQLLAAAIADLTDAVSLTPATDPDRPSRLSNLAAALRMRDQGSDLVTARAHLQEAAGAGGGPQLAAYLQNLVAVTSLLADRTGTHDDLTAAIEALERLLAVMPPGDDQRLARRLAMLGAARRRRFTVAGDPEDVLAAVSVLRRAADTAGPALRPACLAELGHALLLAKKHDQAVDALREACATGRPVKPEYLANLGSALLARSRGRQDRVDELTEAVSSLAAAVQAAPRHPAFLAALADALAARYELTWAAGDQQQAAAIAGHAVEAGQSAQVLAAAGDVLARTGDVPTAITLLERALDGTPAGSAHYARREAMLASALQRQAEATGDVADLMRAEGLLRHARAAGSPQMSVNLGVVLTRIAERTGDAERLSEAIALARQAVDRTGATDPGRSPRLSNLSVALHLAAMRTGSSVQLDGAVSAGEAAVAASADLAQRATALDTLGAAVLTRHLWSDVGADLDAAVRLLRDAVAATPDADPARTGRLMNLGNALRFRGVWSSRRADLDEAVDVLAIAVRSVSVRDAQFPGLLTNLASAFLSRAGDRTDIDTAIRLQREALSLTPPTAPYRPRYLSNLGNALLSSGDARAAVTVHREALVLLPAGHPDASVVRGNLAAALITLADQDGDDGLLRQALDAVTAGADDQASSPHDHITLLWRQAALLIQLADDAAAGLPAMLQATSLAEEAAWVGVAPSDRDHALTRFASLAQDAAACAVAAHRKDLAVTQLEGGRSIGWRVRLQARQIDELATQQPALAEQLRAVGRARTG